MVVDDLEMDITHVIRGNDHLNNTPKQINLFEALGGDAAAFAHVPMIHGRRRPKLSKRHGAVGVMQFRDDGYLPMRSSTTWCAWAGPTVIRRSSRERRARDKLFDIHDVNKAASVFDMEKLAWLNQHYIKEARHRSALAQNSVSSCNAWVSIPRIPDHRSEQVIDVQRSGQDPGGNGRKEPVRLWRLDGLRHRRPRAST